MNFTDIVSISGLPGLFKMNNQRVDGMIVSDLADKNTRFVSSRNHLFTPLESISVYTESDSVELFDVFLKMTEQSESIAVASANASPEEMKNYFEKILPDYDKERVYVSDIKKILRWYNELAKLDIIQREKEKREEKKEETEEVSEEKGD